MRPKNKFRLDAVAMMALSLLSQGDLYGYEIVLKIREIGNNRLSLPEGNLYPVLYKLQELGMVSSYEKQCGRRMIKIFYHIEEPGIEHLKELKDNYYNVTDVIHKVLEYKKEDSPSGE